MTKKLRETRFITGPYFPGKTIPGRRRQDEMIKTSNMQENRLPKPLEELNIECNGGNVIHQLRKNHDSQQ